jgi:aspartokinase/homoserine dehydrogenase 2
LRAERAAQPQVDEGLSYPLLQQLLAQHPGKRLVVTGFISRSNAGETVLLGRNGSDYSATQIGALAGFPASPSGATWPGFTARIRVK